MATSKGAMLAAQISKDGGGNAPPAHSNLFVGNLAATVIEDDLKAAFAAYGEIESALLTSKAGRPSGFVKMVEVEAAAKAVAALNGKDGWVVKFANYDVGQAPKWTSKGKGFGAGFGFGGYGSWFPPKGFGKGGFDFPSPKGFGKGFGKFGWDFGKGGGFGKGAVPELREDGPEKPEPPASNNLYVKHLPLGVTEDNVRDTFSTCGTVQELRILRPNFALECAALVRFDNAEEAGKARTTLDETVVRGQTPPLYANAQTKQGNSKKDHVYLKNVPTNASEEKVKALVAKYGEVKWMKVMRSTGSTCAALCEMGSEEEAQAAIAALNENVLDLSEVAPPMKVRYAANKTVKEAPADGEESEQGAGAPQIPEMPVTRLAV